MSQSTPKTTERVLKRQNHKDRQKCSVPKKRRNLATESMPGPSFPISFSSQGDTSDTENEDFVGSSQNSQGTSPISLDTTPFVCDNNFPIIPTSVLDTVVKCKLRNEHGQVSLQHFKIYFSSQLAPSGCDVTDEICAYDSLGAAVYYRNFKAPKDLRQHCSYIGHVVHKIKKSSPESPSPDDSAKGSWFRLLCHHCDLALLSIDKVAVVEVRYGNNSKFKRHLTQFHPDVKIPVTYERLATKLHSENFKELMKKLMDLIVFENLPFAIVSSKHFHGLCQALNPAVVLPSVDQFTSYLEAFVRSYVTNKPVNELAISNCRPDRNKHVLGGTVSMDAWGSPGNQHILTLQYQYTDSQFFKRRRILGVKQLVDRATGKYVSQVATSTLDDHSLLHKFFFSLADSGSNMTCAFNALMAVRWGSTSESPESTQDSESQVPFMLEDLEESFPAPSACDLPGVHVQFRCCSHLCNLVVGSALDDSRCEKTKACYDYLVGVLKYIRHRCHLQDRLRALLGHGAKKPCAVRWNSAHDVIKIYTTVDGFKAIQEVLVHAHCLKVSAKERDLRPRLLRESDFVDAQELYRILNCLARPTDTLQSDNATAPVILSTMAMAYQALQCFQPHTMPSKMSIFRDVVIEYFKAKLKPLFSCDTLIAATAINPMKKNLFTWIHENMPSNPLGAPTTRAVKQLLERLIASGSTDMNTNHELNSLCLSYDTQVDHDSEVARYYSHLVPNNTEFGSYWRYHRRHYPKLARLARVLDGLPASTGKVERLFSVLGRMQGPSRCRLSVGHMETMLMYAEVVRGEDEIIQDKPLQDSNYDAYHSCNYSKMHASGAAAFPPLLSLPNSD